MPNTQVDSAVTLPGIQQKYKLQLDKTNAIIRQQMSSIAPQTQTLMETLDKSRGKQLRPLFCYSIFSGFQKDSEEAVRLAAVFESIHIASLLHDDVIDKCQLRRNLPTMNDVYGDGVAILLGDLVFVSIYQLAAATGQMWLVEEVSKTIKLLVEGELLQQQYRFNKDTCENDYKSVIYRKTAALLELCCYATAKSATNDEAQSENFKKFGSSFGLIFQMVDDWADFCRACKDDNKDRGVDIANGILTLPWLLLLENSSGETKEQLLSIINQGKPSGLTDPFIAQLAREIDLNKLMKNKVLELKKDAEFSLNQLSDFDSSELTLFLNYIVDEFTKITDAQ
ncbi:MAG: polyprenyl synthetase family protein [Lentisphaeraceae bacterium]|nr:polyprenyl synthetase family protein [Lentisphaeraceae bacterium]